MEEEREKMRQEIRDKVSEYSTFFIILVSSNLLAMYTHGKLDAQLINR